METIGKQEVWSFYTDADESQLVRNIDTVRAGPGHRVSSFMDLATKVAELQFRNREHVLLFRGQRADHLDDKKRTTLRSQIFRWNHPPENRIPGQSILTKRFQKLERAGAELMRCYENDPVLNHNRHDTDRLKRQRILRWSILQHYEVCATPLLDVTHSLRIAASFASHKATGEAFVFVLGVPNLSGAITASAEAGVQIVRLSSVCPPCAVRPHLQEGYLLGEYPEIDRYEQKAQYHMNEIDFGRRLIAKFKFEPNRFWRKSGTFPRVAFKALYPPSRRDPLSSITSEVKRIVVSDS